jgi:Na+/H+ antiporter NhaC
MTTREKLLMLLVFVLVIVLLAVTHVAGHLAFVIENFFALVLPMLNL